MLRRAGRTGLCLMLGGGLLMAGLALAPATAKAADVDLEFTTPTNDVATTVTVDIGATRISVLIPPGTSAPEKRNLIRNAIRANAVPRFTVEDNGPTGLTIRFLTRGTVVTFSPARTGEAADRQVAGQIVTSLIGWGNTVYDAVDVNGDPSLFTAGVISDLGEAQVTLSALDLPALDSETIAASLFEELVPQVAGLGVSLLNVGSQLQFTYDRLVTTGGGIIFGTTALTEGLFGSVVVDEVPEPASLALVGMGLAAAGLGLRRRRVGQAG